MRALLKKSKPSNQNKLQIVNNLPIEAQKQKIENTIIQKDVTQQNMLKKGQFFRAIYEDKTGQNLFNKIQKQLISQQTICPKEQQQKQQLSLYKKDESQSLFQKLIQEISRQTLQQILQRADIQTQNNKPKQLNKSKKLKVYDNIVLSEAKLAVPLYQQIPYQLHETNIDKKVKFNVKQELKKLLQLKFNKSIDQCLDEELKIKSKKLLDYGKITHNYLKRYGSLPNNQFSNLGSIKVKFQCQIPLSVNFHVGDFGDLCQSQEINFKKIQQFQKQQNYLKALQNLNKKSLKQ